MVKVMGLFLKFFYNVTGSIVYINCKISIKTIAEGKVCCALLVVSIFIGYRSQLTFLSCHTHCTRFETTK